MEAVRAESRQVSCVYFPDPRGYFVMLPDGSNARVLTGEPAYQVSDGDIVTL